MIKVNAMGDRCPVPVVKTMEAIRTLTQPEIIEVSVDNEIAVQNIMKMSSGKGYKATSEKTGEAAYLVTVDVDHLPEQGQEEAGSDQEISCNPDRRNKIVAVFSSALMGRGDDVLGGLLMKGYIYALSGMEKIPSVMLFYNSGVTLTTEGSESLEDLKNMEAMGVEILSCGTCLNHYGLTDKLQVGSVTNMYDIVEKMLEADKIIRP